MKKYIKFVSALGVLGALVSSCGYVGNHPNENAPTDTPAKGEITVAVDESFQNILDAEKYAPRPSQYLSSLSGHLECTNLKMIFPQTRANLHTSP
mgnify:CR=1 FL=1